ncbi:MAG: M60 family metallopeptidase [Bacteroidales bacterium]|jgi:hypothetical protein|nr:M60 family metallopeptidase [Bacteroidales bacterium]
MKKIAIIICLFITSYVYPQTPQEITDRFDQFNTELMAAYGKDHEKSIKILNDIVDFFHSLPSESRMDSTSFYCQTDMVYCMAYNTLKEYEKATVYLEKIWARGCNNLYTMVTNDEFGELSRQKQAHEIFEKVKNSAEYKFYIATQKINKSFEQNDYKGNIENAQEALSIYNALKDKNQNQNQLCQLHMLLSMSYSALNDQTEALGYLKKAIESGCDYAQLIDKKEFNNIRTTKEFAKLTGDTTLTAPGLKPGAWGLEKDIPVKVSSAKASNEQRGEGADRSIDGHMSTIYHSSWSNTVFPVTLEYTFNQPEVIDYMIYYPRTDGSNGNFKEIEVYISENSKETLVGKYDFKGSGTPSVIDLQGKKPKYVKVIVKSGLGDNGTGFASCAEMQFFRKNEANKIPDVFSDFTCSNLRKGIKVKDIDAIANPQFKALAQSLYNSTYDKQNRVKTYQPYPNPSVVATRNKTGTYSLLDNATGIVAMPGEEIVVFVGDTKGQNIALRSINFNNDYSPVDYMLKEGANSIICQGGGLLYIMYHTENKNASPIKIHIASGKVNGMYHATENTNSDWTDILDNARHKYIDVQGKYAHLIFPVNDFKKYTPDISRLLAVFDSIVYLESRFIGLEKYKRANGNRMLFYVSTSPYWMFATANRTGYSAGSMSHICDVNRLRTTDIWGPAHEVGHINQTQGLKWVGLTEVSNNIYSMYVQSMFGNKSRLSEEKLNSSFDGIWNNRYEKGFTEMLAGKVLHSDHGDVFCKLIPFWQLQLYFSNVKGNTDFYADVHEAIRNLDHVPNDAQQQLNFMRICCDVSKTDLSEFFERWGMLAVTSGTATDHSSIQNRVNYTRSFTITQKEVEEFKKYASRYAKPDARIWYIHDECVEAYKNNAAIEKGKVTVNGANYATDTKNAVAYEVYDGDKLVFITPASEFKLPDGIKNPVIYAVPAIGKTVKIH